MKKFFPAVAISVIFLCIGYLFLKHSVSASEESAILPVIMYHSVLQDPSKSGEYIVTPQTIEKDLQYLKEHNYQSVTVSDLIAFVDGKSSLPKKSVMLTFDDGHYNNLTYVQPLLEKYSMKAVIFPVGAYTERFSELKDPNPNYAYFSWEELRSLSSAGYFEIQNHSYDLHGQNGSLRKTGETSAAYKNRFLADLQKMQTSLSEKSSLQANAFAYPFGAVSPEADSYLRELGIRASFTTYERRNILHQGDPDSLYSLGRFNRPSGISTSAFMNKILYAPIK